MVNLKVAFFTEAGTGRGMGHLVRMCAILEKFKQHGAKTTLYVDSDVNYGYKYGDINYFSWDSFVITERYDIVFVDSYIANIDVYEAVATKCNKAVYIDDYSRLSYPEGVIINVAPDAETYYLEKDCAKYTYLLGLDYVPIRESFLELKPEKEDQIFIMLGGNDILNLSLQIVEGLSEITLKKVVVCNNLAMAKKLGKYPNTKVLFKPDDVVLSSNMSRSRIAISTASMGVYELAYLKIPVVMIAIAKNQADGVVQFINHRLAHGFIDIKDDNYLEQLKIKTKELLSITPTFSRIDGLGTQRIYEETVAL